MIRTLYCHIPYTLSRILQSRVAVWTDFIEIMGVVAVPLCLSGYIIYKYANEGFDVNSVQHHRIVIFIWSTFTKQLCDKLEFDVFVCVCV